MGLAFLALSVLACVLPIPFWVSTPTSGAITGTQGARGTPSGEMGQASVTRTARPSHTPTTRATFTATLPALPTVIPSPSIVAPDILSQVDYEVVERIVLTNAGPEEVERVSLWVALIGSVEPYQFVLDQEVQPAAAARIEDEYGNQYARIQFANLGAGGSVQAVVTYTVRVNEVVHDLSTCVGEVAYTDLDPELHVESDDPTIQALAQELSDASANPCQTLRALYDYVGDHITYTSYEAGDRGAAWALEQLSGDCTEFADALLALSRASGIPARFLEGVTYREGAGSQLGETKHDWLEAYLPGHGWVPLDPTWARFAHKRDTYFARMSPDHIIVTRGRNLSTLGGYHYFYYAWGGGDVDLSHEESWQLSLAG